MTMAMLENLNEGKETLPRLLMPWQGKGSILM